MVELTLRGVLVVFLSTTLVALIAGCGRSGTDSTAREVNQQPQAQQVQPSPRSSPLSEFESNLQYVRNGLFTYIWVFSRKDGKPLDKDDAAYLRKNAPQVVDWVGTDGGKRYIAGTNFDLEKGNLDLLMKRFIVEDYSAK